MWMVLVGKENVLIESWKRRHKIGYFLDNPPEGPRYGFGFSRKDEEQIGDNPTCYFCVLDTFVRDSEIALDWLAECLRKLHEGSLTVGEVETCGGPITMSRNPILSVYGDSLESADRVVKTSSKSDYQSLWDYAEKKWGRGSDKYKLAESIKAGPSNYSDCVDYLIPKVNATDQNRRFNTVKAGLNQEIREELQVVVYRDGELVILRVPTTKVKKKSEKIKT